MRVMTPEEVSKKARGLAPREQAVLRVLLEADGLVSADYLLREANAYLGGETIMGRKRTMRKVINHLITQHRVPIDCKAGFGGGYGLIRDTAQVEAFYGRFRKRAMTGLVKAAGGKRAALVEMIEQLPLFELDRKESAEPRPREQETVPIFLDVVTRYLDRLSADPDEFAEEIAELQEKYGDVFMPRHKIREIRDRAKRLLESLPEVAG